MHRESPKVIVHFDQDEVEKSEVAYSFTKRRIVITTESSGNNDGTRKNTNQSKNGDIITSEIVGLNVLHNDNQDEVVEVLNMLDCRHRTSFDLFSP